MKSFRKYLKEAKGYKVSNDLFKIYFDTLGGSIVVKGREYNPYSPKGDTSSFEFNVDVEYPTPLFVKTRNVSYSNSEEEQEQYTKQFEKEKQEIINLVKKLCDKFDDELKSKLKSYGYQIKK